MVLSTSEYQLSKSMPNQQINTQTIYFIHRPNNTNKYYPCMKPLYKHNHRPEQPVSMTPHSYHQKQQLGVQHPNDSFSLQVAFRKTKKQLITFLAAFNDSETSESPPQKWAGTTNKQNSDSFMPLKSSFLQSTQPAGDTGSSPFTSVHEIQFEAGGGKDLTKMMNLVSSQKVIRRKASPLKYVQSRQNIKKSLSPSSLNNTNIQTHSLPKNKSQSKFRIPPKSKPLTSPQYPIPQKVKSLPSSSLLPTACHSPFSSPSPFSSHSPSPSPFSHSSSAPPTACKSDQPQAFPQLITNIFASAIGQPLKSHLTRLDTEQHPYALLEQANKNLLQKIDRLEQINSDKKNQVNILLQEVKSLKCLLVGLADLPSTSMSYSNSSSLSEGNFKQIQKSLSRDRWQEKQHGAGDKEVDSNKMQRKRIADDIKNKLKEVLQRV